MNRAIFREYDIRGVAETDLDEGTLSTLIPAIGQCLAGEAVEAVAIGRDCRISSPRIATTLSKGLSQSGFKVFDLGMVPTPAVYFAQYQLPVQAGIMVTGSHNPAADNGLKIVANQEAWCGERIQQILKVCDANRPSESVSKAGEIIRVSIQQEYSRALIQHLEEFSHPPHVIVDAGNGATGGLAASIYSQLGCQVHELFGEPDGRFPNHHPDPTLEENLAQLRETVVREGAALGIAFDGDGDRVAAVDHLGNPVWGDRLTLLFSRDVLSRHPGATIIGEVKCSMHLFREIERLGGKALMSPSGHSIIKREMRRSGALLAGEMSGHIFFADRYYGFDDAIYAGARLLELMSRTGSSLFDLLAEIPSYAASAETRLPVSEEQKFRLVKEAREWFAEHYETILVDGVRVEFEDGWGLIRASNTGPWLILRFEADTKARLMEIRDLIETPLRAIMEETGGPREDAARVQGDQ